MQSDNLFIGTGHNPQGPDLPLGLGMQLVQHPQAIHTYAQMTTAEKEAVIRYVQGSSTGEDAEHRVTEAIRLLSVGKKSF